jgi:hypothetical protein
LFKKYTVVDELLGGLLGIVQGVVLVGAMILILDSFFRIPGIAPQTTELPFLRDIYVAYDGSITADIFRTTLIPGFMSIVGPLMPNDLRSTYVGTGD